MKDWDVSRIRSLIHGLEQDAERMRVVDLEPPAEDWNVRLILSKVDVFFRDLRVIKALLVRERKSRA